MLIVLTILVMIFMIGWPVLLVLATVYNSGLLILIVISPFAILIAWLMIVQIYQESKDVAQRILEHFEK